MDDCIFCKIVRGEIPNTTVFEDDDVLAFMDINPISKGHTLVIPKVHAENLYEIPGDTLTAIHRAAQKIARAMKNAIRPEGIACLQLNGEAVGQVVMHYHLHLVPRVAGAPPLPVSHWELKPGDMDEIRETAETIKTAL